MNRQERRAARVMSRHAEAKQQRRDHVLREPYGDMDPLTSLGLTHHTDKVEHGFCTFYHTHLDRVRQDVRKVLEIGILRGASLRMWRDYFPNATIHGFDLNALAGPLPDRIHLHQGDQANRDSLRRLLQTTGSDFDLIVDDGGHTMEQQQVSLGVLFPHLRPGGLYALEDLHTSFMPAINYYSYGRLVHSVPTGIHECLWTTCDLVHALAGGQPPQSSYLSASELDSLTAAVEGVEIFDRDRDRNHITSFIRKRRRL
jgi:Methyltransferase domain